MRLDWRMVRRRLAGVLAMLALLLTPVAPLPALAKKREPKLVDACIGQRSPFSRIKNYQRDTIFKGVGIGVATGAAVGVANYANDPYRYDKNGNVVRDANGNPVKRSILGDIAVGVIAGAAAGAVAGYIVSLKKTHQNQAELQAALASRFDPAIDQFSTLPQSLADLGNCRRQQIFAVQVAFERKEIDADTARRRLDTIEKWIREDDKIISSAAKQQSAAVSDYAQSTLLGESPDPEKAQISDAQAVATFEPASAVYAPAVVESYVDAAGTQIPGPPPEVPTVVRYVVAKGANLRAEPSTAGAVVTLLPIGEQVDVRPSSTPGWSEVFSAAGSGFMSDKVLGERLPPKAKPLPDKPRVKPVPVAKPKPANTATKLAVRPPTRTPRATRERVNAAVGGKMGLTQLRSQNDAATSAQLAAARRALLG